MRTVAECFYAHQGRLIDKWAHYLPIYEQYFRPYVGKPVRLLEIGVSHGGSLQLWKEYFGPKASIAGMDIDPRCKEYEEDQIYVQIEDQSAPTVSRLYEYDIVIDDGSHEPAHQEASFNALWQHTKGVYLIEDIHGDTPKIVAPDAFCSVYPWVMVLERPKRVIRGTPSREMREDEVAAFNLYSDV